MFQISQEMRGLTCRNGLVNFLTLLLLYYINITSTTTVSYVLCIIVCNNECHNAGATPDRSATNTYLQIYIHALLQKLTVAQLV